MHRSITRREALKNLALAAGAVGLPALQVAGTAHAADAPHVSTKDPLAIGLAYVEDASKVDPAKFANYRPGEKCANCVLVKGNDGEAWRPCNLFALKLVNANGWCRSYTKKS